MCWSVKNIFISVLVAITQGCCCGSECGDCPIEPIGQASFVSLSGDALVGPAEWGDVRLRYIRPSESSRARPVSLTLDQDGGVQQSVFLVRDGDQLYSLEGPAPEGGSYHVTVVLGTTPGCAQDLRLLTPLLTNGQRLDGAVDAALDTTTDVPNDRSMSDADRPDTEDQ